MADMTRPNELPSIIVQRLLVTGGRDFEDGDYVFRWLTLLHLKYGFKLLIHGGARGADTLADVWARGHGVQPVKCDALWPYYRARGMYRAAGVIRNGDMLLLRPQLVLAIPWRDRHREHAPTDASCQRAVHRSQPRLRAGVRCMSLREYTCKQCRQRVCDVSGIAGDDVCATCVHLPCWSCDPQLRKVFHFDPYAEACLRAFALELFKDAPNTGAFEGWDLEALAVKHGLFLPTEVTEPCGTDCFCQRYGEGFPMMCNKRTALLTGEETL